VPTTGIRDLDHLLPPRGKPKERIALIGVEVEGGWTTVPKGVTITHDGSVRGLVAPPGTMTPEEQATAAAALEARVVARYNSMTRGRVFSPNERTSLMNDIRQAERDALSRGRPVTPGEIPSPIMPPKELESWMRKHYPQVVNETCGLHVHMSFDNALHYQRLMVPSFQETLFHYVTLWAKNEGLPAAHPLWPRLRGESRYCRHDFWPDLQVIQREKSHDQNRHGHRYTALNFCHGTHGTLECRLLPMFDTPDQGIRAVQLVLDVTNAFLSRYKQREERVRTIVVGDEGFSSTKASKLYPERRESTFGG
jgi:hypothetical protein